MPLDVATPGMLEAVFDRITKEWGQLDILVHSLAYAPKQDLQGPLIDCSAEGFKQAMDISCHSFVRMARLAAPLMKNGGSMFAMSYHGANKVVPNYNVMGPVKAALEASCRYLAFELGGKGIRVHAISPGPLKTRAASSVLRSNSRCGRSRLHDAYDASAAAIASEYSWCKPPKIDLTRTSASAANRDRDSDFGASTNSVGGSGTPGPNALCGRPRRSLWQVLADRSRRDPDPELDQQLIGNSLLAP
jgi:NAD(P)-dependent dehydrogenase (short-subunit alcohol dehydrogenase family)